MPSGSMNETGLHGYTGTTSSGQNIVNGMVQTPTSVTSDGGASASGSGPQFDYSGAMNMLGSVMGSSGSELGQYLRDMETIAHGNSAMSQQFAREQMDYQTESDRAAMAWSAEEAKKNRTWQTQMSNTSHQREVKDLMKAGLNPILSVNNGATTPSGATGQAFSSGGAMGSVDPTNPMNIIMSLMPSLIASATQMKTLDAELQMTSMNNASAQRVANSYAGAQLGAASMSADASRYVSDNALAASKYGANLSYKGTTAGHKNQMDIAKLQDERSKLNKEIDEAIAIGNRNSPNGILGDAVKTGLFLGRAGLELAAEYDDSSSWITSGSSRTSSRSF